MPDLPDWLKRLLGQNVQQNEAQGYNPPQNEVQGYAEPGDDQPFMFHGIDLHAVRNNAENQIYDQIGAAEDAKQQALLSSLLNSAPDPGSQTETHTTTRHRNMAPFQYRGTTETDIDNYLGQILASMAQQYDAARGALGNERTAGLNEIGSSFNDANAHLDANANDFNARAQTINNNILANSFAAQQANQGTTAGLARDLAGQGGDVGAVNAYGGQQAGQIAAQNQAQQALGQRLAQVQGQAQNASKDSAALVNQGAQGTLTSNYNNLLAKIAAQQAQDTSGATQDAMKLKMQARDSYNNALQNYLNASGDETTTETITGNANKTPMDPLDRYLKVQQVQANQQALAGGSADDNGPQLGDFARQALTAGNGDYSKAYLALDAQRKDPNADQNVIDQATKELTDHYSYYNLPTQRKGTSTRRTVGRSSTSLPR